MSVIVDTSVWSLAFRRRTARSPEAEALAGLLEEDDAILLGVIRLELLSGMPDATQFHTLRDRLRSIPDYPLTVEHYEVAAESFTACRLRGVQGSHTDFLLCAVSVLDQIPIFTTDKDFDLFVAHLPIRLFSGGSGEQR